MSESSGDPGDLPGATQAAAPGAGGGPAPLASPAQAASTARAVSTSWLPRALMISALLHALVWAIGAVVSSGGLRSAPVETVDIELAPPPPKAETLPQERPPASEAASEAAAAAAAAKAQEEGVPLLADAGPDAAPDAGPDAAPDAGPDARPRKKPRPDAGPDPSDPSDASDAATDASTLASDAAPADARDGGVADGGAGSPADATSGADPDAGVAVAQGSPARDGGAIGDGGALAATDGGASGDGGAVVAFDPEAGLGDTPTSAGTASNLLSYFPKGHLVTALIRFDRLRGTRWAKDAERLLAPMPDYRSLFGVRDARLVERFDTLVISSPRPRDPTATTLAARSAMSRRELRAYFSQQGTSIDWSPVKGGALGLRSGARQLIGDSRVVLSPSPSWFFLAPPADLAGLTAPAVGEVDTIVATAKLPPWLARAQAIDAEAGTPWGPALIVTVTATRARWKIPELGLGVTSIPAPERGTLAMELVKQGWVVRGNVKLASDADAEELVTAIETVRQRIADSTLLQTVLRRANAYNAVQGLSVKRIGSRVAYATSISIKDAQILMALAIAGLEDYFGSAPAP